MYYDKQTDILYDNEPAMEALFLSTKDIYINYEAWGKSSENNILFITGFSGSGKTTLGYKEANNHYAVYYSIDHLQSGKPNLSNPFIKDIFDRCPEYKEFCINVSNGSLPPHSSESIKIIPKLISSIIESAREHYPNRKYIVEGFQLYSYCPAEYILGKPLIVKGTSALKSLMRRLKRDDESIIHLNPLTSYLKIMRYYKWFTYDNKHMKSLIKTMKEYKK